MSNMSNVYMLIEGETWTPFEEVIDNVTLYFTRDEAEKAHSNFVKSEYERNLQNYKLKKSQGIRKLRKPNLEDYQDTYSDYQIIKLPIKTI